MVRELRGTWWLPTDNPEQGLPGVLTLAEDEFRLQIEGTLLTDAALKEKVTRHLNPAPVDRILGLVRREGKWGGREYVTLERCQLARQEYRDVFVTVRAESYWPTTVCIGAWFEEGLPLAFDHAYVQLSSLHPWTALSGFEPMGWLIEPAEGATATQSYERPPERTATLDDGTVVKLSFPLEQQSEGLYTSQRTLTQASRFVFDFPEPRDLEYVQALVFSLRNLLTLATGRGVRATKLVGYRKPLPGDDPPVGREGEILYGNIEDPNVSEAPNHHDMVFLLSDIDERFEEHMRRWFRLRDELGLVLDLYFSNFYVSRMFMQTRFMNFVQAIEGYHRRRLNRLLYTEDKFKELRDAILAGSPESAQPLAEKALTFANEVRLSDRIADVLDLLQDPATSVLFAGKKDGDGFARRVGRVRNIYAHLLNESEPTAGELWTLTYQLKALVEALLLHEIGFDPRAIDKMLEQSGKYQLIRIMRAYQDGAEPGT